VSRSFRTVAPPPPARSDGKIFRSRDQDSSLQFETGRSPVPKPCQHDPAARFWQDNVGNSDSRMRVMGRTSAPAQRLRAVKRSPRPRWRCTATGTTAWRCTASSPPCARPTPTDMQRNTYPTEAFVAKGPASSPVRGRKSSPTLSRR
jgi:hypothetical protein